MGRNQCYVYGADISIVFQATLIAKFFTETFESLYFEFLKLSPFFV